MTAWVPDLVKLADRAAFERSTARGENVFEVVDKAAQLVSAVVTRILTRPVTHDVKLWEFIHVLLVFMRALKTRPRLKERFGYAFHPELMAPLLNKLLRQFEIQGGSDWKVLFRPEFPTMYTYLNKKDKPKGKYSTRASEAQWEAHQADVTELRVCTDIKIAVSDAVESEGINNNIHVNIAGAKDEALKGGSSAETQLEELLYMCPLPEDYQLRGFFFARDTPLPPEPQEALHKKQIVRSQRVEEMTAGHEYDDEGRKSKRSNLDSAVRRSDSPSAFEEASQDDANDGLGGTTNCGTTPILQKASEITPVAVGTIEDPISFTAGKMVTNDLELESEEVRQEEDQRKEGLRRDPYFYPAGWFKQSKYDFQERLVRHKYVQDVETIRYRHVRMLWTTFQLMKSSDEDEAFFSYETDEDGHYLINVPGALVSLKPYFGSKMPQVIRCDGGAEVVYIDPALPGQVDARLYRRAGESAEMRRQHIEQEKARQDMEKEGWVAEEEKQSAENNRQVSAAIDGKAKVASQEVSAV